MKESRFTEAQIARFLAQADAGVPVAELDRESLVHHRQQARSE